MQTIKTSHKVFFWIILGMLSTFFAEVLAGSAGFPFFTIWGILMVFPLYTLHTLFFFGLIYRYAKPTLPILYTCGMLFGMYEAYITKVIWTSYDPATGPLFFSLAGISVYETLILVLFWHSVLAFIVPLLIAETQLTRSRNIISYLPNWIRKNGKKLFIAMIIFGAFFTNINSPNAIYSFASTASSAGLVVLLMYIWNKKDLNQYQVEDLVPKKRGFVTITILLLSYYAITIPSLRFEYLPSISPQISVLIIYALLIFMLTKLIKKSKQIQPISSQLTSFSDKTILKYFALFVLVAVVSELILGTMIVGVALSILVIFWPGIPLLYYTIKKTLKNN